MCLYCPLSGRNRPQGVGAVAEIGAQEFTGPPRVNGEEGGQDLRHRRAEGRPGHDAAARPRPVARPQQSP